MARPRKWSVGLKAEAMALAAELGAEEASQRTGIPAGTIRWYVSEETHQTAALLPKTGAALVDEAGALRTWRERRPVLLDALSHGAVEGVTAARNALAEGRGRDAKDASVAVGIMIDKALLLSGGATSRTESLRWNASLPVVAPPPGELDRLRAEVAELEEECRALGLDPDEVAG